MNSCFRKYEDFFIKSIVVLNYSVIISCLVSCKVDNSSNKSLLFELKDPKVTEVRFGNYLPTSDFNVLEYLYYNNGGGVAIGDINNDGLEDIYFTANQGPNALYLNKGGLRFEDISEKSATRGTGAWTTGVTMADVNNDGWLDIYVCVVSGYKGLKGRNLLYINNKDNTFREEAENYEISFSGFSTQAAFFDYDNDGDLDMYLLNSSVHSQRSYGPAALRYEKDPRAGDRLYKNLLKEGKAGFLDVTDSSGIYSSQIGYGLGVGVSDINLDGWPDIYISNDFHENDYLYINQRDGSFRESLETCMAYTSRYSMGNDIADINNDGLPDIMVLDMLPADPEILLKSGGEDTREISDIKKKFGYGPQYVKNTLQLNRGNGTFMEIGALAGVHATDWSWAPLLFDMDNDGLTDIFVTNGILKRPNDLDYIALLNSLPTNKSNDSIDKKLMERMPTLKIPNYAFSSSGNYVFADSAAAWGLGRPSWSNGAAYGDLDNDGDYDLVVNNMEQEAFVYENKSNGKNHFVKIALKGIKDNHFGFGARVLVYSGEKLWMKEVMTTRGFLSSVSPTLLFGLGKTETIDSVQVIWPGNKIQRVDRPCIDCTLQVEQDGGLEDFVYRSKETDPVFQSEKTNIPYRHIENTAFSDFDRELLMPYMLSREGPAVAVADINGDGRQDVFLGGAHGQEGALFIKRKGEGYGEKKIKGFYEDREKEDVDAVFFDADNDGDMDLYVVGGGNQFPVGSGELQDRLYFNTDGKGDFQKIPGALPVITSNGAVVRPADYDGDGDTDLFIGSRSVPGFYGRSPDHYILENNGSGKFRNVTEDVFPAAPMLGMLTAAVWCDVDGDNVSDLIVAGDWSPIQIYKNEAGKLTKMLQPSLDSAYGWWRSLVAADLDGDGDMDLVAGNVGLNMKVKASKGRPVLLYSGDLDNNGKHDAITFLPWGDRYVSLHNRETLEKQMPFIINKFSSFNEFAAIKDANDLFGAENTSKATVLKATTFTSVTLLNEGGEFTIHPLPVEAQMGPVNAIAVSDFNQDGKPDLFVGGGGEGNSVALGPNGALPGRLLINKGGAFVSGPSLPGLIAPGKSVLIGEKGNKRLLLVYNNDSVRFVN